MPGGRIPKDGFAAGRPDGIYLTPRGKKAGVIKEIVRDKRVIHSESLPPDGAYDVRRKEGWSREHFCCGRWVGIEPLTWPSAAEYLEFVAEKLEAGKWDDLQAIPDHQRDEARQVAARLRVLAAEFRSSGELDDPAG
jgi:hypothetical protein